MLALPPLLPYTATRNKPASVQASDEPEPSEDAPQRLHTALIRVQSYAFLVTAEIRLGLLLTVRPCSSGMIFGCGSNTGLQRGAGSLQNETTAYLFPSSDLHDELTLLYHIRRTVVKRHLPF